MAAPRARRKPGKKSLKSVPFDIDQVYRQAIELERQGRIDEAMKGYRAILAARPRHARTLNQLGSIALSTGNNAAALECFQKAARSEPRSADFRNNIAIFYYRRREYDKALMHLNKVLAIDPDHVGALRNAADAQFQLGHLEKAREFLNRALAHLPDDETLKLDNAELLLAERERERARSIYRDLIDNGVSVARAYGGLVNSDGATDRDLHEIEQTLQSEDISGRERALLHFAAGQIAEKHEEFDRAFGHFRSANDLYPERFDLPSFVSRIQKLKDNFNDAFAARRRKFGVSSDRPIFIFGMPRSGTSLVEQIVSAHSQVAGGGELPYFWRTTADLGDTRDTTGQFLKAAQDLSRKDYQRIAKGFLSVLNVVSPDARNVTDKTPHNFERLWLLATAFPEAYFIHCQRDPMSNCVSCYCNPMWEVHRYATDLTALGRYYRLYRELMDHWRRVLPVNILDVQYEDLVSDPETQIRRLIAHLDLDLEAACLRPHENLRNVRTLSSQQVQRPIYTSSVEGWRRYESHLDPLKISLGNLYSD